MQDKLQQLKEIMAELYDLRSVFALLDWDMQVNMPPGGAEDRSNLISTISRLIHERWTADETGKLIEDLYGRLDEMDPASDNAAMLRKVYDEYQKKIRVPAAFMAESTRQFSLAHEVWMQARAESNFELFQPSLERIVDLVRQYAGFFAPFDHVYDPLLNEYERGMKTVDVRAIFQALRPQQVELIQAIGARPQVDDAFLHVSYSESEQWDFGVDVITRFGYDWNRGRQDRSTHPFTTGFGLGDIRITTRFDPERAASALFSTMHEAGHAMYEQGIDPALRRSPLSDAASMAFHESQSRMWENLVGRSLPFWKFFFPRLKERFPAQLDGVDLMTFYKGINKVESSLIRVEADEATYNLHIMLRLELEIALLEGSLAVKDLPEAWNARMQEYLGVTPPDDAQGVLQDVHWSAGLFGYFPTYALGNLVSVQLWETMRKDIPDLDDQMEAGQFTALLDWMREKVHRQGARFEPQELVQRVTGSKIDPQPYVRYLQAKFGEIYGL